MALQLLHYCSQIYFLSIDSSLRRVFFSFSDKIHGKRAECVGGIAGQHLSRSSTKGAKYFCYKSFAIYLFVSRLHSVCLCENAHTFSSQFVFNFKHNFNEHFILFCDRLPNATECRRELHSRKRISHIEYTRISFCRK